MKNQDEIQVELNELLKKVNDPKTNLEKEGPALFPRYVSLFTEAGDLGQKGDEVFDKIMESMKSSIANEIKDSGFNG